MSNHRDIRAIEPPFLLLVHQPMSGRLDIVTNVTDIDCWAQPIVQQGNCPASITKTSTHMPIVGLIERLPISPMNHNRKRRRLACFLSNRRKYVQSMTRVWSVLQIHQSIRTLALITISVLSPLLKNLQVLWDRTSHVIGEILLFIEFKRQGFAPTSGNAAKPENPLAKPKILYPSRNVGLQSVPWLRDVCR